ncbi:MAG: hypothetical protein ACI9B8_003836, partial [Sulfitobacter sp.]
LYTRYEDLDTTVSNLVEIMSSGRYQAPRYRLTGKVT